MVVLATKCYVAGDARDRALDGMNALVDNAIGELDADWTLGVREDEFVQVDLSGGDATAAENLLAEEWGRIPEEIVPGEEYVGTLEAWGEEGFRLDAGRPIDVPAPELGLGPGSPKQIVKRYGLVQHLPMRFVAGDPDAPETNDDESSPHRLADAERDRLYDWTRGSGRVNVNSATRGEVRATVNRAGHARDIVTVERLGLLEQSIVCAEDTDPPGLLAAIGEYLPAELRCVVP